MQSPSEPRSALGTGNAGGGSAGGGSGGAAVAGAGSALGAPSTVERVHGLVRSEGLLAGDGPIVAMLSGGRDSVCLLDVTVALCGAERVRALHVNYRLRPEADADEAHCRETARALGVSLDVVHAAPEERQGNVHAWARELRYHAAAQLARRLDADARITTGHTSTDQAETILYRLAASPGRRALLGMAPREGRLVRPLLGVSREDTAAYCRERGLGWREDASNDDERYARARVRGGLVPALRAVHPAALANVLRTAELLREETRLLDALVQEELRGAREIAIERLRALPAALQRLVVVHLAESAAGTPVPQAGERVGELLALAARGGRAELHVGGLASAVIESGVLRFVKIAPREQRPPRG